MNLKKLIIFAALCVATSCSQEKPPSDKKTEWQQISGRENKTPIYRIKTPSSWLRKDPSPDESLDDTKKSILEFHIPESSIRITIHNFPSQKLESRIPPAAQIARWKQQFIKLDQSSVLVQSQSFSGYAGLMLDASGNTDGEQTSVIGWSMQLAPEHYRTLTHPSFPLEVRADITIKATGPKNLMTKHRPEIYAFAQSFELIEEIPAGL